jgi:endonuclease/exonuclease/phosphatase (EEP) superfamily protein YafD
VTTDPSFLTERLTQKNRGHSWITPWIVTLARVYFIGLFTWVILRLLLGDRWWWLFLLNSFAAYLFLPLPLILVIALLARKRETWIGFGVALALGTYLYGGLFLPTFSQAHPDAPTLTVMTYNLLGYNENREGVVATIRATNADVVALQELNSPIAKALQRELGDVFPYQMTQVQIEGASPGVISRYPLHPTDDTLPGTWAGAPQVLSLDYNGARVTLLQVHTFATGLGGGAAHLQWTVRERERQAHAIVEFAATHSEPLIVTADFNAGDQSVAYAIVTSALKDAWREAGWGFGHTFPGGISPGLAGLFTAGVPFPMWLVRIDYVFHSRHWQAAAAWTGPWDGASDHRPVVAQLILAKP